MIQIRQQDFARIVQGICDNRESIIKHNPIGTDEEILLWMLLNSLTSFLSLSEAEAPCFAGKPDANTYREAIRFVLEGRRVGDFPIEHYLDDLCAG